MPDLADPYTEAAIALALLAGHLDEIMAAMRAVAEERKAAFERWHARPLIRLLPPDLALIVWKRLNP